MRKTVKLILLYAVSVCPMAHLYSQTADSVWQSAENVRYHNIAFGNKDENRNATVNIGLSGDVDVLQGVQWNLFSSVVRRQGVGLNAGVFAAVSVNDFKGLQSSSFTNAVGGKMTGVQFSGMANSTFALKGVQLAGLNNVCESPMMGLQLCGITNISLGVQRGAQIAAIMNVCEDKMRGFQFSAFNYCDTLTGNQLGLINLCVSHPRGVQIGIVNYTRKSENEEWISTTIEDTTKDTSSKNTIWQLPIANRKIGLVNISSKTKIQLLLYGGNIGYGNTAARFLNTLSYSMLGFTGGYKDLGKKFTGALFYRTGFYKDFDKSWRLSSDMGFSHIETFNNADENTPERLYSLQFRANIEYQIMQKFGLFASLGYQMTRYYDQNAFFHKGLTAELGIILF